MAPDSQASKEPVPAQTFTYLSNDSDQPAVAIVEAVSWVIGIPADELAPLNNTVNTEALNRLFSKKPKGSDLYRSLIESSTDRLTVTFQYEGCSVRVSSEEISIEQD